jgi:DNA-binding transcriptional regulator LsrR (DeoR family)
LISKQQYEAQLQQIFRLLLENRTQEEIAHELNISTRRVARYSQRIDKRYGEIQRQKTDDTLFLECHLFKNRMLNLYKALETKVLDDKTSGTEKARCAEIAANIALDVLKMESEGIRAVKEGLVALAANKNNNATNVNNNNLRNYNYDESDNITKEYDPNRKF